MVITIRLRSDFRPFRSWAGLFVESRRRQKGKAALQNDFATIDEYVCGYEISKPRILRGPKFSHPAFKEEP
jgi:hypothetical protein